MDQAVGVFAGRQEGELEPDARDIVIQMTGKAKS